MTKEKFWHPNINDEISGMFIEKVENVGEYNSSLYKIQNDEEIINIWGKKQLDSLMNLVTIGDKIILKYVGTEEVNEHQMKKFELEILNE
ncbi:MAG: hypothetical protein E7Z85_00255 [Methanosphaera stadtmanae]|nr:hypothetical protein [Methanosphaera stadtmanae]